MALLFRLPDDIRAFLKNPYGPIFEGDGPEVAEKISGKLPDMSNVISVGDVTTFNLFSAGMFPRICIVDDYTKRLPISFDNSSAAHREYYTKLTVENPPGFLSDDLIYAVGHAVSSSFFTKIVVEGEEDLASLPAIAFAPVGSVILYGQPGVGMVFVEVTKKAKKDTISILKRFLNPKNLLFDDDSDSENLNAADNKQIRHELCSIEFFCKYFI